MTARMNIRIPETGRVELEKVAKRSGYSSGCALARAVLMRFLRHTEGAERESNRGCEWIDDMFIDADREDPRERKRINERL